MYYTSPEQNAERRINKGKTGQKLFLYHYKSIETANQISYNYISKTNQRKKVGCYLSTRNNTGHNSLHICT